ncbi:MAG: DUF4860 domain-containing protein [Lachnospiraceae bacterium]|nr:DUF4860 domain-containing protein [Lachnospiraceae bacterium]
MKTRTGDNNRHVVDVLFVLALFGVFAASALLLVTIGASVYKQTVSNMDQSFTDRTSYSYLVEKIHQNDIYDAIEIGELEGSPALVLTQRLGEEEYCTYLYLYEGYLMELFTRKNSFAGTDLRPAGQNIMPLDGFHLEAPAAGLIKITIDTGNGSPITLYTALRSDYS